MSIKKEKKIRRHRKITQKIYGTKDMPRLFVFRSNQHIYAQLIDDDQKKIIFAVSEKNVKVKKGEKKLNIAKEVGIEVAKLAKEKKIMKVAFDRGGCLYHGRIKSLADGAREAGLKF